MATIEGKRTLNELCIYEVDQDPSAGAGTVGAIGDIAMIDGGSGGIWRKFGAGDTQWTEMVDKKFLREESPDNVLYVAKNGNDSNDGSFFFPKLTIGAAVAAVSGNTVDNPIKIVVAPGTYIENPITVPDYTSIKGEDESDVIISAANPNANLLTLGTNITLAGLTLEDVTNPANWLISITTGTGILMNDLRMRNCSNGIFVSNPSGTSFGSIRNMRIGDTVGGITGTAIDLGQGANFTVFDFVGGFVGTMFKTESNAILNVNSGRCVNVDIGVDILDSSQVYASDIDLSQSITTPIRTTGGSCLARLVGCIYDQSKVEIEDVDTYSVFVDSTEIGESRFIMSNELSVGLPERGRESSIGQGDSFVRGMMVYTQTSGGVFTDVSVQAASADNSTFLFPGTAVNSAIYVSCDLQSKTEGDYIKFPGIKIITNTAAVGGEIVAEYWTGSTWTEFNHMSTRSSDTYLPYAKQIFQRTGSEQIRFDVSIDGFWQKNDPISSGTNRFWVRFRVVSTLSVAPVFEQFKVHTNRSEINEDGFIEFFGTARPISTLPFDVGSFSAANSSPSNQDLWIGDNLGVGRIENQFDFGTIDRSGLVRPFPNDIDTSTPIRLTLFLHADITDGAPNYSFTVRWGYSNNGSLVGDGTGDVPTVAATEQALTQTISPVAANQQFSVDFYLDVSDIIAQRSGTTPGDLFWCTIQRNNDGNFANISLIQIKIDYASWRYGGHIKSLL